MSKYTKLDALILMELGKNPKNFSEVFNGEVSKECERIHLASGTMQGSGRIPPFRICERRLKWLSKAGKIDETAHCWIRNLRNHQDTLLAAIATLSA